MKIIFITSPGLNNQTVLPTLSNQLSSFYFTHPKVDFDTLKRLYKAIDRIETEDFSEKKNIFEPYPAILGAGHRRIKYSELSTSPISYSLVTTDISSTEYVIEDDTSLLLSDLDVSYAKISAYDSELNAYCKSIKKGLKSALLTKCMLEVPVDLSPTTVTVYCVAIPTYTYEKLMHDAKIDTPEIVHTPERLLSIEDIQKKERKQLVEDYFKLAQVPFSVPLSHVHIIGAINCKLQADKSTNNYTLEFSAIEQDLKKIRLDTPKEYLKALQQAMYCFQLSVYKGKFDRVLLDELRNHLFDFRNFCHLRNLTVPALENRIIRSQPIKTDYFCFASNYNLKLKQKSDHQIYTDVSIDCSLAPSDNEIHQLAMGRTDAVNSLSSGFASNRSRLFSSSSASQNDQQPPLPKRQRISHRFTDT